MEKLNIKNAGVIEYELLNDLDEKKRYIADFLVGIIKFIANQSVDYYGKTEGRDHIFIDSEGEFETVITKYLLEKNLIFKREFPVWRKYSTSRRGNIDYWIQYNDMAVAMELKLAHKGSVKADSNLKRSIYNHFNKALKQLEDIEKTDLFYFKQDTNSLSKIVFEEILFYSKNTMMYDDFEKYHDKVRESFFTLFDSSKINSKGLKFDKKPNFCCLWHLDENIAFLKKGRFGKNRVYPTVGFIANIDYHDSTVK